MLWVLASVVLIFCAGAVYRTVLVPRRALSGPAATPALPGPAPILSEAEFAALKHLLSRFQYEDGTSALGERAATQLKEVRTRGEFFFRLLSEKLEPGEVTFGRYNDAARSVQSGVIANLREASTILQQWKMGSASGSVPGAGTASAASSAAAGQGSTTAVPASGPALLDEVRRRLDENDQALRGLDGVTTAIRDIRTSKSGATDSGADLGLMIGELEELARRARKYSS